VKIVYRIVSTVAHFNNEALELHRRKGVEILPRGARDTSISAPIPRHLFITYHTEKTKLRRTTKKQEHKKKKCYLSKHRRRMCSDHFLHFHQICSGRSSSSTALHSYNIKPLPWPTDLQSLHLQPWLLHQLKDKLLYSGPG